jgi:hypothetical protein
MYRRAGQKLWTRNPAAAPESAASTAASAGWPVKPATIAKMKAAMAAVPAESPSMLSSRLKALVMPTTQSTVRSTETG